MTATTFYSRNSFDNRYRPYNGRLSARKSKDECAWEAKEKSTGTDYLQVDLGGVFFICALATKGNACDAQEWTETYKIYLSSDGKSWNPYTNDSGVVKVCTHTANNCNMNWEYVTSVWRICILDVLYESTQG